MPRRARAVRLAVPEGIRVTPSDFCNFDYHYNRALVESKEDTIQCRKMFFEALDAPSDEKR